MINYLNISLHRLQDSTVLGSLLQLSHQYTIVSESPTVGKTGKLKIFHKQHISPD